MSKKSLKDGFSLVEVVIALSIIMIVSITALSIVLSSVAVKVNAINKSTAQNFAGNVWESFKAADTQDEFLSLVDFAEGVSLTDGEVDGDGYTVYTYYSEKHKFSAEISVKYSNAESDEFKIAVTDKDGDGIISFSYRKGDGT